MKLLLCICFATLAYASPVNESKALSLEDDPIGYFREQVMAFLDGFLEKDNYKVSEDVEVTKNSFRSDDARSAGDYEARVEQYIKSHDVIFRIPVVGKVTVDARNMDSEELNFKVDFGNGVQEARKSKLKKILIPILVFVLLKAMTLVPLALGILSLKAWNALQLSFFSFVISVGLAIFQLCKKIAADHAVPAVSAHGPWEPAQQYYAARSFDSGSIEKANAFEKAAQNLAYSAHIEQ